MEKSIIPEWILLNNQVIDENGDIKDLNKDKEAGKTYFFNENNKRTKFLHSLKEKFNYLVEENNYEEEYLRKYTYE